MAAVLIDSGQRLDSANSYGDNALHILCRRAADTAREIAGKERFIASFGERWVSEKQQREAREELEELQAEQMRCYATAALPRREELGWKACVRPRHGGRGQMGGRPAFGRGSVR